MSGVEDLPVVDVLLLTRPHSRPPRWVVDGIERQQGVRVRLHVGTGWPERTDTNRWQTIARGRNELKQMGSAPWVMFVDDDVELHPRCIRTLVDGLRQAPALAALAADSEGEHRQPEWRGHVGMAACLFRREVLEKLPFRATLEACECLCCQVDLKAAGWGIAYERRAQAKHFGVIKRFLRTAPDRSPSAVSVEQATVMAAFDRRDFERFQKPFLKSLRNWGNREPVIAVAYGLYPSERRRLAALPGVRVEARPANGEMAPVRRLDDFAEITRRLPSHTPVAYWDVADVVFQNSLAPLWQLVAKNPQQLLAVIEPKSYPYNGVIPAWALSINDPVHRQRAWSLLQQSPFLNSGFAAGTAAVMHGYFETARHMRRGPELSGTTDWGDQMCLNLYCHTDRIRWQPIPEHWNYCVHDRPPGEVHILPNGIITSRRLGKIAVAHGNARSLRQYVLLPHASV